MKKFKVTMFVVFFIEINLSLWASHFCDQKFNFLGVTGGNGENNTTFWIIEDVGGECGYSTLWQVADVEKNIVVLSSNLKYMKYGGLLIGFNDFDKNKFVELKKDVDNWKYNNLSWSLTLRKIPIHSSEIKKFYIPGSRIIQAMKDYGLKSFDLPKIDNLDTEPIYCGTRGVYRNYRFDKIYYYRKSTTLGYVLIFTSFRSRISGMDTANGFILFRVSNPPEVDFRQSSGE